VASPLGTSPRAAHFALDNLATHFEAAPVLTTSIEDPDCARLRSAVLASDLQWQDEMERIPPLRGLGATLAFLFVTDRGVAVAHLGDCRAYQLRNSKIVRRTVRAPLG
jgi:serine/threonine protein phosphatase PrpC